MHIPHAQGTYASSRLDVSSIYARATCSALDTLLLCVVSLWSGLGGVCCDGSCLDRLRHTHDCVLQVTPDYIGKAADIPAEVFVPDKPARSKQARKAPATDGLSGDGDGDGNIAAEEEDCDADSEEDHGSDSDGDCGSDGDSGHGEDLTTDETIEEMRQREAASVSAVSRAERNVARSAARGGEQSRAGATTAQPAADSVQPSSAARGASGKRSAAQRTASGKANEKQSETAAKGGAAAKRGAAAKGANKRGKGASALNEPATGKTVDLLGMIIHPSERVHAGAMGSAVWGRNVEPRGVPALHLQPLVRQELVHVGRLAATRLHRPWHAGDAMRQPSRGTAARLPAAGHQSQRAIAAITCRQRQAQSHAARQNARRCAEGAGQRNQAPPQGWRHNRMQHARG